MPVNIYWLRLGTQIQRLSRNSLSQPVSGQILAPAEQDAFKLDARRGGGEKDYAETKN